MFALIVVCAYPYNGEKWASTAQLIQCMPDMIKFVQFVMIIFNDLVLPCFFLTKCTLKSCMDQAILYQLN
jgi:hypothetical protein